MPKEDLERDFPELSGKDYDLSPQDFNYNCLAFALGDVSNWWEPGRGSGHYWPPGFSHDVKVSTVEEIIKLHGYRAETGIGEKPNAEAIAIYAIDDEWTHFARYSDGHWHSKLGEDHDVSRIELNDLAIGDYGSVCKILCRLKEKE